MIYKCKKCGHGFSAEEAVGVLEFRGECFGFPAYEEEMRCPRCGGADFEEAEECEICGKIVAMGELNCGACNDCIYSYKADFDTCKRIFENETESIEINSLYASLFEVSEIEDILKNYIKSRLPDFDLSKAINRDRYWFGQELVEEVNKK